MSLVHRSQGKPPMSRLTDPLRSLGAGSLFLWDTLRETWEEGLRWERVMEQAWSIGIRSIPVLTLLSMFVGSIVALQGYQAFHQLGADSFTGMFVNLAGVREVCPLLAATMVAAKSGTELAAQLAVMRSREQIDALEVMGVGSRAELVAPSLVAIVLVMPALTIMCLGACLLAATWVGVGTLGLERSVFLDRMLSTMELRDIWVACTKGLIFGVIIVSVSTFQGYFAEPGPGGVGKATNRAVVVLCLICVFVNYFLTEIFYG